jgi:pyoverdine/dityrosine biosynthesis protein Dit1/RimJ/RimL family protein N-acetyltransferase
MTPLTQHRNEPFGHLVPEAKLERYWAQCSGLVSLRRPRVLRFDPNACATYAPTAYEASVATIRPDLPSDDWLKEALCNFIRTEFSDEKISFPEPSFAAPQVDEIEVSDAILHALAKQVDSDIEEITGDISPSEDAAEPEDLARQIYSLLCHPRVGSKANANNVDESEFVAAVAPRIVAQERLLFVFLGFPFKDQNRFRVEDDAGQPDLGEISFLLRLYRTVQAIYQLHPHGADILVLTDGELYQEIFGISKSSVARYVEALKSFRSYLNLQGAVSFISLKDLVDRASVTLTSEARTAGATAVQEFIRERLEYLSGSDASLRATIEHLISGIKWNHESRQLLKHLTPQESWAVLAGPKEKVQPELVKCWEDIHQKASVSAISYLSTNLMLRWLELVRLYFPDAVRCTIHAKRGQICLTKPSAAFPWNGVAWTSEWPTSIDHFEVRPWLLLNQVGPIRKVTVRSIGRPYFYTGALKGSNIVAARSVLLVSGWSFEGIFGRQLVTEDAQALTVLGSGDENFAWEMVSRDEDYYRKILQFRLDHYQQYGFGVHGIWLGNQLIGQFGLQVLNETRDQVELVIFLGKAHVRRGLGQKLTEYLLSRCKATGLRTLYGVVRPENKAALRLLRRFNAKPSRTQVHFGYIATVFSIPIGKE